MAKVREGKAAQPTKGELIRVGAEGGLLPDVYELLRSDPRLAPLAVEAAHIMWHQAGGPDRVSNGLVNGGPATREALIRFHGKRVQLPRKSVSHPDGGFVEWHRREVFRSRELAAS